jgi:predicted translin family RNA/ssDNA-binding protein
MATTKKAATKVQNDIESLGRNLQVLSKKLLGDVTKATLNTAEKALTAAQKQLQKVRAQMDKPNP